MNLYTSLQQEYSLSQPCLYGGISWDVDGRARPNQSDPRKGGETF